MIKRMKKYAATILAVVTLLCLSIVCINYNHAYASEEETNIAGTFEIVDGASIRTSTPFGMRFTTKIGNDFDASLSSKYDDSYQVQFGTVLTTADRSWDVIAQKFVDINGETYREYRTVLTDIPDEELATVVTAKSYVKVYNSENELVYTQETASLSRSAVQVASIALAAGDTFDVLYDYVKGVDIALDRAKDFRYELDTETLNLTPSTVPANCKVEWSVDKTEIATVSENGELKPLKTGSVEVIAKLGKKTAQCSVKVIKVIKTEEDFLKLFDYLTVTVTGTNSIIKMDGYVEIGANLDFSSMEQSAYNAVRGISISGNAATTEKGRGFGFASYLAESVVTAEQLKIFESVTNYGGYDGFVGTIDGQGHSVKGLQIASWGIFPAVGINGTIKNLALTDVSLGAVYSYALSGNNFYGTLDNCLIDVKAVQSGEQIRLSRLFGGTLTNSIVYMPILGKGTPASSAALGYKSTQRAYTITRSFVIGTEGVVAIRTKIGDTSIVTDEYFTSLQSFNDAEKDYSGFDTAIWDFEGYAVPVFKTYNGTNIAKKA